MLLVPVKVRKPGSVLGSTPQTNTPGPPDASVGAS